jgi:FkbM family methyltransferase
MLSKKLKYILNAFEYPELIKAQIKKIDKDFTLNLAVIKNQLKIYPKTILDIGAAIGEWSRAARLVFPESNIYSFEPIPHAYEKLKILEKRDSLLKTFNCALSTNNGVTDFYLNDFFYSSSLLKMTDVSKNDFKFTRNEKLIKVETRRLEDIKEIIYKSPVYVKMDVQGAELNVLYGAESLINKMDVVQLEVNFESYYDGQANYKNIFTFFFDNNFKYIYQDSPYFLKDKIVFSDFIFFK